jgi:ubiquinone biosynthesis protein COQ4
MTADVLTADRPIPAPRRDWGAALRALRRLLRNKEDTRQVFEIMRALTGDSTGQCYRRLCSTARGGRIAYERQEFAHRLMDDAWLDSFPDGTVGAAYRQFVRSQSISADGLAGVSREGAGEIDALHPVAWMARRIRDVHDVWHVLSGYGRDGLGEACLVAFSYPQTRSLGWALIALGAISRTRGGRYPYVRAIWQGYQRGKKAKWLLAEDYEALFAEPLDQARRRLGITPPTVYDAIPPEARDIVASPTPAGVPVPAGAQA